MLVTAPTYPSIPDLYTHCKARQVKASTALTTRRLLAALQACAAAAFSAGCATQSKYPPAPAQAAVDDYTYLIGAGDLLNIIVLRNRKSFKRDSASSSLAS